MSAKELILESSLIADVIASLNVNSIVWEK